MKEPSEHGPRNDQRMVFLDRHLALVATIATVAFATLRVYFSVGFDVPTAMSVLAVADRTNLLASSLLNAVIVTAPIVFAITYPNIHAWFKRTQKNEVNYQVALAKTVMYVIAGILILVLIPILTLSAVAAGLLLRKPIYKFLNWWKTRARLRESETQETTRKNRKHAKNEKLQDRLNSVYVGMGIILVSYLPLPILSSPWLPLEAVHFNQEEEPIIGYIVGEQGNMTLILQQPDDQVHWVQTPEITERANCKTTVSWSSAKVTDLAADNSRGVDCDSFISGS